MSFASLGLSPKTLDALDKAGFEHPTPIQAQAIPPALAGKDVIGIAATGTGKTAAFLLPIVERLATNPHHHVGPRALVLAPTRELALQIADQLDRFARGRQPARGAAAGGAVRGAVVIGGVGMARQADELKHHEVVIATPGRLVDHLAQGNAKLDRLEVLVLDEADRMLDMGFKPQLTRILQRVPKVRQTLLFSATMAGEVGEFAKTHLKAPVMVEMNRSGTTAERADQRVFLATATEKLPLLLALLEEDGLSTLVFTRTKRRADKVAKALDRAGHKVTRIHADRSQGQRKQALEGFRSGQYRVLVATDIAARGIDVAEIGHVVNFDLPHVPEDYVHRVGRTARMDASGRASSFASPEEADQLRDIEKLTRRQLPRAEVPRDREIFRTELARAAANAADPGPHARPAGMNRNRRRAAAHNARGGGGGHRPSSSGGGHAPASGGGHAGGSGGAGAGGGGKPKLVGSWGGKRRR
ncbi:MAG: DEAD/DEAH box helicase [Anaeromyxobacteraceae bacterium]